MVMLRDLDSAAFLARYDCDRFTATVLRNRFRYITAHMANQVRTHAFSPVIRDASDLCTMISGPVELGFPMVSVSETMPLFYGSIPDAVKLVIDEYGIDQLVPGDVIIVNDYYRVGTHLNDVCLIRPVFMDGAIVAAVTVRAHFLDMGGIVMGGFEATKRNIWEDGLRIPPMLICHASEPVKATLSLLYANTRLPQLCVPDLITEMKALEMAEANLIETIERYGHAAYTGAVRYACDASAEAMAEGLRTIPDGVYEGEGHIDGDGFTGSPEYAIRVKITKIGDRAEVDLHGTSGPSPSAVNGAWPDIKTGIAYALKSVLDPHTPVTSGTLRNVDIVVPPNIICNANPPAACQLYFILVYAMIHAVYDALNLVLGARAIGIGYITGTPNAIGRRPDGIDGLIGGAGPSIIGAWGATRHGDADSSQQSVLGNLIGAGVELYERESPVLWVSSDYVPDSGGAGEHRGGAAILYDIMYRVPAEHRMQLLFHARRPAAGGGVMGGKPGPTTTAWLFDGDMTEGGTRLPEWPMTLHDPLYRNAIPYGGMVNPATHEIDPEGELVVFSSAKSLQAGAVARVLNAGGGGWGSPWKRDPALVLRDVRDAYVSVEGARRDYGVVLTGNPDRPELLAIDQAKTAACRKSNRVA